MSIAATREPHKEHLLFPWWQVLVYGTAFLVVFRLAQVGLRSVCSNWIPFDCPYYWPISIFQQRVPTVPQVIWAIALLVIFAGALWILERKRYDIRLVCATGILLIAGSTLIQGVPNGFYAPVAGDAQSGVLIADSPDGQEYYHEALKVTDPLDFLRRYNEIQPT
ncbi:MAG TPA: hypothetical protein VL501_01295, partial [Pyrinomonadaceae bacterium]|nr:hypothetical protein [Pyrinomonadaceae bacterium]